MLTPETPRRANRLLPIVLGGAAVVAAVGGAFAATRGQGEPQPVGTATPAAAASPTPEKTPISTPTVSPTPEATPTPTPTPKSIESIIDSKPPETKITATNLTDVIKQVQTENPKVLSLYPNMNTLLDYCTVGIPGAPGNPTALKASQCQVLILNLYQAYKKTNDSNVYNAAQTAYNYFVTNFEPIYKAPLDDYLKKFAG